MTDSKEYEGNIGLITKTGDESIPLVGVFAEATIIGKSSKVKITQKYKNNGKNALEAVYKFPLAEGASVTGFRILLKDKVIKGEIEEREKAFMVYDDAMIKGDGAVLLDQERPNIFTLSVGNLNPESEVGIEIEYISVPDFKNNSLRFFLPTTISPRYIPVDTPDEGGIPVADKVTPEYAGNVSYGLSLKVNVLKSEGMDINSISSPSHKVKTGFDESCYTVEFTSQSVNMDRDFVLEIGYGKAALNRAIYFNTGQESFMQVDFNPDLGIYMQENSAGNESNIRVAKDGDIVFVLDCSGSMEGSSIAQAKKSLEILIKALSPGQTFNIYRFGSSFDKFSLRGEHFDEMSLNAAMEFLDKTDASFGGTEILAPLKDIFSGVVKSAAGNQAGSAAGKPADNSDYIKNIKNMVLITDGEVGNEAEVVRLVHSNRNFFRVFTVGIGFGPNEYFIKEMAQSTGADYIMVHPEERIDLKVISMFKKLNMGAVENIKIDFGLKQGDVDAVPEFHNIFSENSYQIFAKINNAAKKCVTGIGELENNAKEKSAEGNIIEGKSAEVVSIRGGSLKGSNSEGINVGRIRGPINSGAATSKNTHGRPFYEISDNVPENVLITGIFNGKNVSWSLPVSVAGGQDGFAGFIPQLWAREKIREIEGGFLQAKGSQQAERKTGRTDELVISISKKYGVISSKTSFVSVEERSEAEKTKGEVTLKKIPTLVTYGWHGFGAQGAVPDRAFMFNAATKPMAAMPKMRPGAHKGLVSKSVYCASVFEEDSIPEKILSSRSKEMFSNLSKHSESIPKESVNKYAENADKYYQNDFLSEEKTVSQSHANNTALNNRTGSAAKKVSGTMSADYKARLMEEILLEILSSQKPAGGFEFGDDMAAILNIDISDLKTTASGMDIKSSGKQDLNTSLKILPDEKWTLFVTALFMGILESFFKDMGDSWKVISEKSRKWFEEKISYLGPEIKSKPLRDFMSDYISKMDIFKKTV